MKKYIKSFELKPHYSPDVRGEGCSNRPVKEEICSPFDLWPPRNDSGTSRCSDRPEETKTGKLYVRTDKTKGDLSRTSRNFSFTFVWFTLLHFQLSNWKTFWVKQKELKSTRTNIKCPAETETDQFQKGVGPVYSGDREPPAANGDLRPQRQRGKMAEASQRDEVGEDMTIFKNKKIYTV